MPGPRRSLAIDSDVLVVGLPFANDAAGKVVVFRLTDGTWMYETEITPTELEAGSMFGWSVSLSENIMLIGANQAVNGGIRSGAAWLYEFDTRVGAWTHLNKLAPVVGVREETDFGASVVVGSDQLLVGASWEDTPERNSGSIYVYESTVLLLSPPVPGRAGVVNAIGVVGAAPGEPVYFVHGRAVGSREIPGCPGVIVDLEAPQLVGAAYADSRGHATIDSFVPEAARDLVIHLQAFESRRCRVSNLVVHRFE